MENCFIPDVSIVIVNWNTCEFLRNCLASIYKGRGVSGFEVIVVDNASSDGSATMIKTEFPQVMLIENSSNSGFAAANNQGVALASGLYVLLLNPDTIILDDAIATAVSFVGAHPEAAVIGCRVMNVDRTLQPTCFMFPSVLNMLLSAAYLYKLFPKSRFFGRERMTWWDRDDAREVDVVTGCFMLVRHEAIKQVGLMDEQFFVYGEETDWCYRFKQAGWKVFFTPSPQIIHLGGQSSKNVAFQMALQLRGSILKFFRKHRSYLEYQLACFLMLIFFVVRVPVWFVKFLVSTRERAYCWFRMKIYVIGIWKLLTGGANSLCVKSCDL